MERVDRETKAAKATVVVVTQIPGNGSCEDGVGGKGGSGKQEVGSSMLSSNAQQLGTIEQ